LDPLQPEVAPKFQCDLCDRSFGQVQKKVAEFFGQHRVGLKPDFFICLEKPEP
jgi:hypothetical protein